jgi:ubiquinone/menaquinone biosynthesis C-methylase UbiE
MKPDANVPVALFVYNRDGVLERTLNCLKASGVELLYVFSDGPKTNNAEDVTKVQRVREMIKEIGWAKVNFVEQKENIGLDKSIRQGVDHVFKKHDKIIVVEDDVQIAPGFYNYMSECLNHFEGNASIAGVTGLRYPFPQKAFGDYPYDVFFAPRFSSWGWGTWRDIWKKNDFNTSNLKRRLQSVEPDVTSAGADMKGMVEELKSGSLHGGWDIYCALNVLLNNQYFVWPRKNMVENGGFTDGTHAGSEPPSWSLTWEANGRFDKDLRLPEGLVIDDKILTGFRGFFEQIVRTPVALPNSKKILQKGKNTLRKIKILRKTVNALRQTQGKLNSEGQQVPKPNPKEYSTLTSPIEVPVQRDSYFVALNKYVEEGDKVLDVGCGLGYGLTILSIKASSVDGIDVDPKSAEYCRTWLVGRNPRLKQVSHYDGYNLPYEDNSFDVVTSIDVLEHVEDYDRFIEELLRVAKRIVMFGTPNRRPENTNPDGSPKNYWHLREWTKTELDKILAKHTKKVVWKFVGGPADGPYKVTDQVLPDTQALLPALFKKSPRK